MSAVTDALLLLYKEVRIRIFYSLYGGWESRKARRIVEAHSNFLAVTRSIGAPSRLVSLELFHRIFEVKLLNFDKIMRC